MIPHHDYLGLPLAPVDRDTLLKWLLEPDPNRVSPRVVGYLNAHTVNMALRRNSQLGPALRQFDLVYPDGISVVWAARARGLKVPERCSAADYFMDFLREAVRLERTIALVGGREGLADSCARELMSEFPGLQIVHTDHGYHPLGSLGFQAMVRELKILRPSIVLLGMGSPMQEIYALGLRHEGIATTWCVGALFEYFTPGVRKRAPRWMVRIGLEWLYRLSQEPTRLWKRYLLGNIEFIVRNFKP
ncbi:MAG: WecB/TagA/CpsF family glycosyltransferase [Candidatus Sumerlaeia bacterium]|nr:WecB/TagA/CpsF family glycosyltransferase [Candidatus Sumerlaeia bacterium]